MTTTIEYTRKKLPEQKKVGQPRWHRIILLCVVGYEAAGCLLGGSLLVAKPDGRLMDMPVGIMHGVFHDFLIPGIILFGLGILNTAAFVTVLRRKPSGWIMTGLALGGLLIWFCVEIAILQELHWLHAMWGLPVVVGALVAIPLFSSRQTKQKVLLICGILSSLLYVAMLIFVPMQYEGYNSVTQTISELSAIGTPTRPLWVIPGIVYSLLITAFGWGIRQSATQNQPLRIAGTLLFAYGIIGQGWTFAPMHQREVLAAGGATLTDTMHIFVMSPVSSLFMLVAMGFAAAAFGKRFRLYSIATIIFLIVFGVLTGMDAPDVQANLPTPWIGVWERIMLGVFLLWAVVLAIILLQREKSTSSLAAAANDNFKKKVKGDGRLKSKIKQTV